MLVHVYEVGTLSFCRMRAFGESVAVPGLFECGCRAVAVARGMP